MKKIALCILLTVLAGCAKELPPPLPVAPEISQNLYSHVWPKAKQTYQLRGTMYLLEKKLPVRGVVAVNNPANAITVAFLTQLGTSIFEASITQDSYELATRSPLIKKYPQVTPILIKMMRAIYLPTPLNICVAGKQGAIAQLRCEEQGILYHYRVNNNATQFSLQKKINVTEGTTVKLADWSNTAPSYPAAIFYSKNSYGFSASFTQAALPNR